MYKRKLDWKKLDENERQGIIRKAFDYSRDLARSIVDRLQKMSSYGRVDVKAALKEMRPKYDTGINKTETIHEMMRPDERKHQMRIR